MLVHDFHNLLNLNLTPLLRIVEKHLNVLVSFIIKVSVNNTTEKMPDWYAAV